MSKKQLLIIGLLLNTMFYAQLTKEEFFTKIKTERVESDSSVNWKNIAPAMAGYNETFYCHPTDPNVMFMGPDMHVTYGTWDNGKTWQTVKDWDGTGDEMRRVIDFEFSLQNADKGYAIALVYGAKGNEGQLISSNTYDIINGKAMLDLSSKSKGVNVAKIQLDEPLSINLIKN